MRQASWTKPRKLWAFMAPRMQFVHGRQKSAAPAEFVLRRGFYVRAMAIFEVMLALTFPSLRSGAM